MHATSLPYEAVPFAGLPDYAEGERLARAQAFRSMTARRRTIPALGDRPVPRAVIAADWRRVGVLMVLRC